MYVEADLSKRLYTGVRRTAEGNTGAQFDKFAHVGCQKVFA